MNPEKTSSEKAGRTLVKDPVCNMDVDPATAAGSSEYKGQTYYFCSPGCVKRFNADPEKYLAPRPPATQLPKSQMVQIGGIIPAPASAPPPTKPQQDQSAERELSPTFAPWILKSARANPEHVLNAAWRLSLRLWNTPAPCIRKSCATARVIARFAAWPLSRVLPPESMKRTIQNCAACSGDSGLALRSAFLCLQFPWAAWPQAVPCTTCLRAGWSGCNSCLPLRSCSGEAGHSFSAAGRRSSIDT